MSPVYPHCTVAKGFQFSLFISHKYIFLGTNLSSAQTSIESRLSYQRDLVGVMCAHSRFEVFKDGFLR